MMFSQTSCSTDAQNISVNNYFLFTGKNGKIMSH